ncbi:MAG: hypothetical protein FWF84_06120 [Kiritimatiellaeota bacterium]|nr:hypothetical protein [Kiritimatiellota bacterium]
MKSIRGKWAVAAVAVSACVAGLAQQQGGWQVSATVRVMAPPAEADLGVYVQVPNGGLLPRNPVPEVQDAAGNVLESMVLWASEEAMGLVFRPPAEGREVSVLFRGGAAAAKAAATTLKPSLFVMTKNVSNATLEQAKRMPGDAPPAQGAHGGAVDRIGVRWNPFGDDNNFITWYTGWFKLDKPETIYFATISADGSEVWIDGKMLVSWPGIHTYAGGEKGQHGKDATLSAGWHKIDYYHFGTTVSREKEMCMCLVWRRADAPKDALPIYMAYDPSEQFGSKVDPWGRSGQGQVTRMQTREGVPMAWVEGNLQADSYLWVDDANLPVNLYTVRAGGLLPGDKAVTSWDFGQGRVVTNATRTAWLVGGMASTAAGEVSLVTKTEAGEARQKVRMRSFVVPRDASINRANDRLTYRLAFYAMVMAVPMERDPVAGWNGDLWSTLIAVTDPYCGGPVLMEMFSRGWATLRKLPKEQRWAVEDRFGEPLRLARDAASQLAWIERLEKEEREPSRRARWKEERVSCLLYDVEDVGAARVAALSLRETATSPDEIQRAVLRLGDVEWMAGDREKAARFYADAEERYRSRNTLGGARLAVSGPVRVGASVTKSYATSVASADAWKLYAINDTAQSSTIRACLEQNELAEAFAALRKWENTSPTSKLGGEFWLAEARIYNAAEDYRRVASILKAYRAMNAMTSQMPEAMDMNLSALIALRRYDEAKTLAEEGLKRFPGLPIAASAELFLQQLKK